MVTYIWNISYNIEDFTQTATRFYKKKTITMNSKPQSMPNDCNKTRTIDVRTNKTEAAPLIATRRTAKHDT